MQSIYLYICPMPARSRQAPPLKPGSAQGFFLLVREFFLATVTLGLLWGVLRPGPFVKLLCIVKSAIQIKLNWIEWKNVGKLTYPVFLNHKYFHKFLAPSLCHMFSSAFLTLSPCLISRWRCICLHVRTVTEKHALFIYSFNILCTQLQGQCSCCKNENKICSIGFQIPFGYTLCTFYSMYSCISALYLYIYVTISP